jgi:uncharacterized protein Yka (UPF0111/DUF47 family)
MPKKEKFFDLFERHALTIVVGALLNGDEKTPEHCKDIKRYVNEADDITRESCPPCGAPSLRLSIAATSAI